MIIIPPQSQRGGKAHPPQTQHDTTVGMLIVALICLGLALVIFIIGPRTKSPPPILMPYAILGMGVIFGIVSFFSWMKEQADALGGGSSDHRQES